jgi:hypothetical protein
MRCGHGKTMHEECLACAMMFRIEQRKDAKIAALEAEVARLRLSANLTPWSKPSTSAP